MYNDAPVNKEEVFEPFLEPAEVSANFAQWQEQVVRRLPCQPKKGKQRWLTYLISLNN